MPAAIPANVRTAFGGALIYKKSFAIAGKAFFMHSPKYRANRGNIICFVPLRILGHIHQKNRRHFFQFLLWPFLLSSLAMCSQKIVKKLKAIM